VRYDAFGPFWPSKFSQTKGRFWKRDFWSEVERESEGLSSANGIYLFATCHGESFTPWYLGQTCSAGGFKGEVFQGHKVSHYIAAEASKRGHPALFFIARRTEKRRGFSKASEAAKKEIVTLEGMLIGIALTANPKLRNDKKTKFLRKLIVPGIYGPSNRGKRTTTVSNLRKTLGL
jgi:hypothetical protein